MQNYKNNSLDELAASCTRAIKWVEEAAKDESEVLKEADNLEIKLCQLHNDAVSGFEVLPVNTTIGVFGASQAGKSYLVSTLASNGGGEGLVANWDKHEVSFMKHLNPTGNNREATGLVTRFSHVEESEVKGYPVHIKLFNEIEFIKVLINSYFADIELTAEYMSAHDAIFKSRELTDRLFEELENDKYLLKEGEQSYVHDYDIVSLAQYVKSHSKGSCLFSDEFDVTSIFWVKARRIISRLNLQGRLRLFSVLWNRMPSFDNLYLEIAPEIEKLKGVQQAYAPLNAFVMEDKEGNLKQIPQGTLIDIGALKYIFNDPEPLYVTLALDREAKETASIRFPVLAFATAEITFPLPAASASGNFDVLDFPGARSRKKVDLKIWETCDGKGKDEKSSATEFIRRGKVGFLIERYCERHEIDVLLCCISVAGQLEVSELTPYLTHWIEENVGRTPEERARLDKIPLVGAFTRFDECITRDMNKEASSESDIGKTISTALEHFEVQWLLNWANNVPFNQFFFVRRPNMKICEKLCALDENYRELAIRDEAVKYVEAYKQEIIKDPMMRHVYRFSEFKEMGKPIETPTISEVLRIGDGGVSYLASFLKENFERNFTQGKDKFFNQIELRAKELRASLAIFAREDGQKAYENARRRVLSEIKSLKQCDAIGGILADIRELLELDEDLVREDYNSNYSSGNTSNSYRFAKALTRMYEERLESLRGGDSFEIIANNLLKAWDENTRQNVRDTPEEMRIEKYGFFLNDNHEIITSENELCERLRELLKYLSLELSKAYKVMNVEQRIVEAIDPEEASTKTRDELCDAQCERSLNLISDFNSYLYFGTEDFAKVEHLFDNEKDRRLFSEKFEILHHMPDIRESMVRALSLRYFNDYFSVLADAICVKNLTAQSRFNISQALNEQICRILENFDKVFEEK